MPTHYESDDATFCAAKPTAIISAIFTAKCMSVRSTEQFAQCTAFYSTVKSTFFAAIVKSDHTAIFSTNFAPIDAAVCLADEPTFVGAVNSAK